jgi:murein DD-endopeptidase MepM/ murein hydrolase activator NlpD
MTGTPAAEPIQGAPERVQVSLTMILGQRDTLAALLARAGAAGGDAASAAALLAGRKLVPGTKVQVILGEPAGSGRALKQLRLNAALGLDLEVNRRDGVLQLVEHQAAVDTTPLRVRGRIGEGFYWSLRAAGVSPQSAAEYLQALATEIDVGSDVAAADRFDLVISSRRIANGERRLGPLLYAGVDRASERDLQLIRWSAGGRTSWVDAATLNQPQAAGAASMAWPVAGRITSGFGYRVHPILRFARLHKGVDFGAGWGSPIVAAADGQVVGAGWAGGYGRQVRIAHPGALATSYSHMSRIVAEEGSFVRRGELIGYVGSSGLSTGPHLHYEVYRSGRPVNPLSVRFGAGPAVDNREANAIKARLKALLSIGA